MVVMTYNLIISKEAPLALRRKIIKCVAHLHYFSFHLYFFPFALSFFLSSLLFFKKFLWSSSLQNSIINFLVICLSLGTWPCHHEFKSCDLLLTPPLLSHLHFCCSRQESTLLDRTFLLTISILTWSNRHRSAQRIPEVAFKN